MNNDEYEEIYTSDLVELVVNKDVWGMAIGFAGSLIYVRLATGAVVPFHEFELRKMAGRDEPPAKENDNVIDFTRAKDLRNAKTKGAA